MEFFQLSCHFSSNVSVFEASRAQLLDGLAQFGLSFSRWTTTNSLPGGRASQILDFIANEDRNWAVVDDLDIITSDSMMMQLVTTFPLVANPCL